MRARSLPETFSLVTSALRDRLLGGLSFVCLWLGLGCLPAAAEARTGCAALARTPWPLTSVGRADLLQRLEGQREACVENAPFLALLGALWLEQGNPAQALIWLERALLLNPASQGAQLDHALALVALGEPEAARQLYARWRQRTDLPPAVLHRLRGVVQGLDDPQESGQATAPQSAASVPATRWTFAASLGGGYEDNLDRSPTLSEIRLTPPEGPISLPLAVPLVPQKGQARIGEVSVQLHRSTAADVLWQGGLLLSERRVPGLTAANQRAVQAVVTRWHQIGAMSEGPDWVPAWLQSPWRIQNQLSLGRTEGGGSDTHQQLRYLIGAESDWRLGPGRCSRRLELEMAHQRYPAESLLSSVTPGVVAAAECRRVNGLAWYWGVHARWAEDRPLSAERPGGRQSQLSAGLRLGADWTDRWGTEALVRGARLTDREGFSPLLADGAPRRQTQWLLSWEWTYRFEARAQRGFEAWLQWQHLRQDSNIELFRYNANTAYAGLRWRL